MTQMQNMMSNSATTGQQIPLIDVRNFESSPLSTVEGNHNFSQFLTTLSNIDKSKESQNSSSNRMASLSQEMSSPVPALKNQGACESLMRLRLEPNVV